eukprot:gene15648-20731_t
MDEKKQVLDDPDFLCKLIVGIGEVAQITDIPVRQIRYWEDKGIIKSLTEEEGKNRRGRLYFGCRGSKSSGKN